MPTTKQKPTIRLSNETRLLAYLLTEPEITKLESTIQLGDPQPNSTASKINSRMDEHSRWILNRMAPETRRDGTQSSPIAHYWLNPQCRLQVLEFVNHQRQGQGLPPLELPSLPRYPHDHPAWEWVSKGGPDHAA